MKKVFLLLLAFSSINCFFQAPVSYTGNRISSWETKQNTVKNSLVYGVEFSNIGPTVMSGRITDVAVDPKDPTHFYVAYASGGLWETQNNGTSFESLFDHQASITIGDIAVNWNKDNIIWVGTGENNSSRSSYAGTGVYKSTDSGKTWQHMGLTNTQHIGRIILHPTNPDIVWIAALGHLYSDNDERGVFKTTDGGKTWKQVLKKDGKTGSIDLVISPDNPDVLYTALWTRERKAWNFTEAGVGSGVYKSTNGGQTWEIISGEKSGFPDDSVGRIGLAISKGDKGEVVYAILDNQNRRPSEKEDKEVLTKDELRSISKMDFLSLDDKKLGAYLRKNGFPLKYTSKSVKELVKSNKIEPIALVEYIEDENTLLFDTPVIGPEVYVLQGNKWTKTHEGYLDDIYYSYGYYFGQITVDKSDPKRVYIAGVPLLFSNDGGATFISINGDNYMATTIRFGSTTKNPDT